MDQDLSTPEGVIGAVLSASANRQYQLLGALLILVVVGVIRKLATMKGGKLGDLINSDLGGVVLSIVTSSAGAAYSTLKGGAHLDLNMVLSTLVNAALASGIFTYGKHANTKVRAMRTARASKKRPPAPPAEPPAAPPVAPAVALLFFAMSFLTGCTPAQTSAWKTAGIDALKCVGPGVVNAAGSALIDLMAALESNTVGSMDPAALGKSLALKYGPDAAVCALGKAAADLLPVIGLHAAPTARTKLLQGMIDTQKEWAK